MSRMPTRLLREHGDLTGSPPSHDLPGRPGAGIPNSLTVACVTLAAQQLLELRLQRREDRQPGVLRLVL
jgi:hypothetical protein